MKLQNDRKLSECISYREEQKEVKTDMNSYGAYENRSNPNQGKPMGRPEPFSGGMMFVGRNLEEQQDARERQRMQSYYSKTAADLQRMVEAECDRMDYRGSMMYDEFPDRLMMEHTCRNIARQYDRENGGEEEQKAEEELLDLIGVLFYNEMFRRRSRRRRYYNIWI